ncbi:MAG: hypothetical protein HYV15_06870, partial [Elusimicrobia bacterium]|nr:hypothetical protein [Elusimicrobiota bacterium]
MRELLAAQADIQAAKTDPERQRALQRLQKASQASQDFTDRLMETEKARKEPKGQAVVQPNAAHFSGDVPEPGAEGSGQTQRALGQKPGTDRGRKAAPGAPKVPYGHKNAEAGPPPTDVYYGKPPGKGVPSDERTTEDGQGLPPGISLDGSGQALGSSGIGSDKEGGLDENDAAEKKVPPNRDTDKYSVACQRGSHNLEGSPPDEALFTCLDDSRYCPSWNVYEPEAYLSCLKRRGYWTDGADPGPGHADEVLYRCIYHPRGPRDAEFRRSPGTRNASWQDLDYSQSGT